MPTPVEQNDCYHCSTAVNIAKINLSLKLFIVQSSCQCTDVHQDGGVLRPKKKGSRDIFQKFDGVKKLKNLYQ